MNGEKQNIPHDRAAHVSYFSAHISYFSIGWQYCCAALCLVAQDVRNCVLIINEGAIPHMLAGAKDGDMVTKQSCCAVLSTLSSKVKASNMFYFTMR